MPSFTSKSLLAAFAGAAAVSAHGHVKNIVINGASFQGYDINSFPYTQNPPKVVGWTASNTDNGFVGPESFASEDIICHRNSKNAQGYAVVAAGDSISVQWDTWPESHHGPVIDYLASCGANGCSSVDKTSLEFFKIAESGLINGAQAPGKWASDVLIENNNSWMIKIPENIAPGNYVLRHEIIALHSGGDLNGAQNYPQCFNIQVTGSGTARPAGVKGTALYTPTDAGIRFNIYRSLDSYPIPGPALIAGASAVAQSSSRIVSTATALTGASTAAPAPVTTTSAAAVPTPTTIITSIISSSAAAPIETTTSVVAAPATTTTTRAGGNAPRPTRCPGLDFKKRRHARQVRQVRA
ncbi:glycosyl hydrolase family 61-domain-containing protein [Podospora australis]|uniref:lytic cellulose monooxygenase (C4-dehydrogenating) n=1 Tax=Podospora australis TaxID=1536484 RepID=A0AAN6WVY2_9PEZI|nr:glycosyl hydrolase family 61-domain-containing protein [Podospora australis]